MNNTLLIVCCFTFLMHFTEALAYSMRLAGYRTRQVAIALSFVTSTLLISRLSNMFQAPLVGAMVDGTILKGSATAIMTLEFNFRLIIFAAFLGAAFGAFLTPTALVIFQRAIHRFLRNGSLPRTVGVVLKPKKFLELIACFRLPRINSLKKLSLKGIPRTFLVLNFLVTSIYTIGVLCAMLAGAMIPEMRSTAIQLSGIVNGIATILLTIFVDPAGARITDQTINRIRPESDLKTVVFYLLMGKVFGILILSQLFFIPFTKYIVAVTKLLSHALI